MTIGDRLKLIRNNNKLSQKTMANLFGYQSSMAINHMEKNRVEPNIEFLVKVANHFNVNYEWLLSGNGEMDDYGESPHTKIFGMVSEQNDTYNTGTKSHNLNNEELLIIQYLRKVPHMRPSILKLLDAAIMKKSALDDIKELLEGL